MRETVVCERDLEVSLMLNRIPGASPARVAEWVSYFGSVTGVFQASVGALRSAGLPDKVIQAIRQPDLAGVEADLRWLEGRDHGVLIHGCEGYPVLLGQIRSAPWVLFYRGQPAVLDYPQLAVIGSRTPSAGGARIAFDFAQAFAQMGLVITSGLAQGIDTQAHQGVLSVGGSTVAVVGSGPDVVYPAKNRDIADKITEKGVIVSEFPIGTPPKRENFPRRNRILSGLSLGVLVVEAAKQSGTLITARFALEQGREVFAVPGSIHNPLSKGCHALIKEGAKLVESAEDVLQEIAPQLTAFLAAGSQVGQAGERDAVAGGLSVGKRDDGGSASAVSMVKPRRSVEKPRVVPTGLGAEGEVILQALGYDPCSVDAVQERTGLSADSICATLVMLEIEGVVAVATDGRWQRV